MNGPHSALLADFRGSRWGTPCSRCSIPGHCEMLDLMSWKGHSGCCLEMDGGEESGHCKAREEP